MSRREHSFQAGDLVTVHSSDVHRTRYPGKVDRVTKTRVFVTYDASRTGGLKSIKKEFWGDGYQVGWRNGGPSIARRQNGETFP